MEIQVHFRLAESFARTTESLESTVFSRLFANVLHPYLRNLVFEMLDGE